jgi:NADPH-dependent ferric siderophore reductase
MDDYDLAVDFMDMTNDRRLWTRVQDARAGFVPIAGRHVIVGDEDAVPAVARILSVNAEGHLELEVLPGSVDSHRDLLRR